MPCLLVVDDDLDTREVIASILTDEGFSVWTAPSSADALARLASSERPGTILLDVRREDTLDWIKSRPELDGVKVILMAGDRDPLKDDRVVATLYKPFDVTDLLEVARKYCR